MDPSVLSLILAGCLALVGGSWKGSQMWALQVAKVSRLDRTVRMFISLVVTDAKHRQLLEGNIEVNSPMKPTESFKAKMNGQADEYISRVLVDIADELRGGSDALDEVFVMELVYDRLGHETVERRARELQLPPTEYMILAVASVQELTGLVE